MMRRPSKAAYGISSNCAVASSSSPSSSSAAAASASAHHYQYIQRARADSNAGFVSHNVEQIAAHWLPGVVVTQATLGEHTRGAKANRQMLLEMFEDRPDVVYQRHPSEVKVSLEIGFASEEGRWHGQWTGPRGDTLTKSGVYFAQWIRQQQSDNAPLWLLNAEVYAPVSDGVVHAAQTESVKEEVRLRRASSNHAIATHDIDAIVRCWLPSGVCITHSTGDVTVGLEANRALFEQFGSRAVVFVRTAERVETDVEGGVAAELGTWDGAWAEPDSKTRRSGRYMAQWRQHDHAGSVKWLISAEVFVLERHSELAAADKSDLLRDWLREIATDPRSVPPKMALSEGTQQPLGYDLTDHVPPDPPPSTTVLGRDCRLEPVNAARHAPSLHASFAADTTGRLWAYTGPTQFSLGQQRPPTYPQVCQYLRDAEERGGVFVIVVAPGLQRDALAAPQGDGGAVAGTVAYQGVSTDTATATIGHVVHAPLLQGSRAATEAHFLMLRRLFALGFRRVTWSCDGLNMASMRFAARLGFLSEGVQRSAVVQQRQGKVVGLSRAYFSLLQHEWFGHEGIGVSIAKWLQDENFDELSHEQHSRLSQLTAAVRARM
jgi:RimJ/RimL family protein N-acetyltransferase